MQKINLKPKQTKIPQIQKAENFPQPPNKIFLGLRLGSVSVMKNMVSKTKMENKGTVKGR